MSIGHPCALAISVEQAQETIEAVLQDESPAPRECTQQAAQALKRVPEAQTLRPGPDIAMPPARLREPGMQIAAAPDVEQTTKRAQRHG